MSSISLNYPVPENYEINSIDSSETISSWFNTAQIARVTLVALAVLALLEITVRTVLGVASIVTSPAGLIIIPVVLATGIIGVVSYYAVSRLLLAKKNYQDAEALAKMKEAAPHFSFYTLYKDHGLENLTEYIFNEPENANLSPSALREKFVLEATTLDLEIITLRYDLFILRQYKIIPDQFVSFAVKLQNRLIESRKMCAEDLKLLRDKYHVRSQSLTEDLRNSEILVNGLSLGRSINHISTAIHSLASTSLIPIIHEISYQDAFKEILDRSRAIHEETQKEYTERCREFFL